MQGIGWPVLWVQFGSIQDGVCIAQKSPWLCSPPHHMKVSPRLPLKQFQSSFAFEKSSSVHLSDTGPLLSFPGLWCSPSFFHASLLQAINGVMSLALCQKIVSGSSFVSYLVQWIHSNIFNSIQLSHISVHIIGRQLVALPSDMVWPVSKCQTVSERKDCLVISCTFWH